MCTGSACLGLCRDTKAHSTHIFILYICRCYLNGRVCVCLSNNHVHVCPVEGKAKVAVCVCVVPSDKKSVCMCVWIVYLHSERYLSFTFRFIEQNRLLFSLNVLSHNISGEAASPQVFCRSYSYNMICL